MPTIRRPNSLFLLYPFFVFSLFLPKVAFAQGALTSGDINKAKALYQSCQACHGEQGQGNPLLKSPALAGQFAWYIKRQLKHFRSGLRGKEGDSLGQQMVAISRQLKDEKDLELLAAYIESLPGSGRAKAGSEAGNKNGYRYYQGKCGACHGSEGRGNAVFNAPKLTGQQADYLLRQMKSFSEGKRGADKEDKFGRQMAMMAKTVSGQQLSDIVNYLVAR
ncbi:c-type cytochrome [Thalassomonas actiniarum]|uniref:Cytochrome c n=1 Tax=Thalassomonas actiniarum TaxID=485447 RepID=A0AAE9YS70_9GAMM|nr:c-type cytochrome [Thalassomonas actiniarum]WDD99916.1 cytochrome c [Thalassomonas actiniarum]